RGNPPVWPGDAVVRRRTRPRGRPADEHGWTYLVAMLRPLDDRDTGGGSAVPARLQGEATGEAAIRRVHTGEPTVDGGALPAVGGDLSTLTDIWLTGGPLRSVA